MRLLRVLSDKWSAGSVLSDKWSAGSVWVGLAWSWWAVGSQTDGAQLAGEASEGLRCPIDIPF